MTTSVYGAATCERCGKTVSTVEMASDSPVQVIRLVPEYHAGCGGYIVDLRIVPVD